MTIPLKPDEILRRALETPRVECVPEEVPDEVLAQHRAALPGVPLYRCQLEARALLFRPIPPERFDPVLEVMGALPDDAARDVQQSAFATVVEAALLWPSMDDVLAEAAVRPALLATLTMEVMRVSGSGAGYQFRRT